MNPSSVSMEFCTALVAIGIRDMLVQSRYCVRSQGLCWGPEPLSLKYNYQIPARGMVPISHPLPEMLEKDTHLGTFVPLGSDEKGCLDLSSSPL